MRLSLVERIGVLIAIALTVLGLRFIWLNPTQMGQLILHWAYWFLLAITLAFSYYGYRVRLFFNIGQWIAKQGGVLIVLTGLWGLCLVHERFMFKINYDEHVLLSISRSMHYEHIAGWQADGKILFGSLTGVTFMPDKRPVFFPFILSIFHNVIGYRPANAFVLNSLLAGGALLGVYRLGWSIGGKIAGVLMAALLAGVPLLAQNATSGGFDLLNTVLIIALAVAVWNYLNAPTTDGLKTVAFLTIFLANTRYESVLYVTVPFMCWLWNYLKDRSRVELPWIMILMPLAILPALFANGVFNSTEAFFQMSRSEFWNYKNYGSNLAHAVSYLFDPDRGGTNSVLLASSGLLSLIFLPLIIRREALVGPLGPGSLSICVISCVVLSNITLILGLGWGNWDDVLVSRFTLPLWFFLAWCATYVVLSLPKLRSPRALRVICSIALGYVLVFSVADASVGRATNNFKPAFLLARSIEFLKKYDPWRQTLIIAGSALPYLNEGFPALAFNKDVKLAPTVNFKLYENVVAVLHYKRDSSNGAWMGDVTMAPFQGAIFETLKEFQLDPFNRIVIARVVSLPAGKNPKWIPSSDDESPEAYARRIYQMLP